MSNDRVTAKERNLIKGAIRRVFSRSDLRRSVIDASVIVGHVDNSRPRVKTWCRCSGCKTPTPKSYMEVDHIDPVVPVNKNLTSMTFDDIVNRIWCEFTNLQAICPECHTTKTKTENKLRREARKKEKDERK
jgi:5-methylcytosine-specific restriction endonuclease McrA